MSLYDTVIVNCPNCNEECEFQTKSGDCLLEVFTLENCPEGVLQNINRHSPYICDCGISFEVDIKTRKPVILKT